MTSGRRELLVWLGSLAFSAVAKAATRDLVVVVHPRAPTGDLSDVELEGIFLTLRRFWRGSQTIIPFNLAPRSEPRVTFDQVVLQMDADEVARYWLDRRVRGGPPPPRQAPDPVTLARLVARLEGAIGYAPADTPLEGVRVVARVRSGKVTPP